MVTTDLACRALALWTAAGSWSQLHLTAGLVPPGAAARLMGWPLELTGEAAQLLVDVGMWEDAVSYDPRTAMWRFRDWPAAQPDPRNAERVRNLHNTLLAQEDMSAADTGAAASAEPPPPPPGVYRDGVSVWFRPDDADEWYRPGLSRTYTWSASLVHHHGRLTRLTAVDELLPDPDDERAIHAVWKHSTSRLSQHNPDLQIFFGTPGVRAIVETLRERAGVRGE